MTPDPGAESVRERLAKATPGPWRCTWGEVVNKPDADDDEQCAVVSDAPEAQEFFGGMVVGQVYHDGMQLAIKYPDAQLIAHAPTDLAYLLAQNDALWAAGSELARIADLCVRAVDLKMRRCALVNVELPMRDALKQWHAVNSAPDGAK